MLHCYFELLEFVDREDESLAQFVSSATENKKLKELLATLERCQSVFMMLQSDDVMLCEARVLFNALLNEKPVLKRYLGSSGSINSESACVRI